MNYYEDPRLSASKLNAYLQHDPKVAHWQETHSIASSDALRYGTALHSMMEGKQVTVSPHDAFRTKEAKAWKAENPDFLKADECLMVEAWQTAILNHLGGEHPFLLECWKEGTYEPEYFTETHKAKIDCIRDGVILDWKTTWHSSRSDVVREYQNAGAAVQASHYLEMAEASEFHFVVVSKVEPHPVWVLSCSPQFIDYGAMLKSKAEMIREDYLNGLTDGGYCLEPPKWAEVME